MNKDSKKIRHLYFYITVGILAFGTGVWFVYQNAPVMTDSFAFEELNEKVVIPANQKPIREQNRRKDFVSQKEKASLLFKPTLEKWLSGKSLEKTVEPTEELTEKIKDGNFNLTDEWMLINSAQKSYRPSLIDVNGDGKDELTILSNFSPPEFSELWILKRSKTDFEVILSTYAEVENFSLRKRKTEGYFDIETTFSYPGSETSLGMSIYKFDGKEYVKMECYDYIYLYRDENGDLKKLKKPRLMSLHCC
ncbi:MAG: hypothetical protein R2747_01660 [Pyrinomonadaceae bacterium]